MALPTARRSFLASCGLLAAGALTLAGCGSDSLSGSTPGASSQAPATSVAADSSLKAMLPQSVQDSGVLRVGTNATYAPNEFLQGDKIVGMDIDIINAVAAKLGVKAEFTNAEFDSLIGGVSANRYDAAISSFSITDERLQQIDMVQYFSAGTQWATKKGNPDNVDPNSPCGLSVSVQTGSTQQLDDLPPKNEACTAAGKPGITVLPFDSQADAANALVSGRVQAMLADSPVTAYAVKQTGDQLELVGDIYDSAPYGIVLPKGGGQTAEAVSKALEEIAKDGSYETAMTNWGAEAGAVTEFPVNP
ncbi:ABC transporter substrate-binding protein [Kineococcus gynurae]|uniref:ABC transporter substrate-binding protein n=1 Tax=Kineococcus gynurae TaxID=452979 RepID=A0ABV5LN22_9ACTN